MARLQFDHNVSSGLAPILELTGHDVIVADDIDAARWTDDALLLSAVRTSRTFITHNRRDFRLLHDAWVTWPAAFGLGFPPHPGILVMDAAFPETLARVIVSFLDETPAERLANAIVWWHRHDGWRQPIAHALWEPYRPSEEIGQE